MGRSIPFKRSKGWYRYFQYDTENGMTDEARNILLIVATLIAAVTFQAGVNPPGGVWQDNKPMNLTSCQENRTQVWPVDPLCDKPQVAGTAIYVNLTSCQENRTRVWPVDPLCDKPQVAGTAIYASQTDPFYVFLVFNTVALSTSVLVIMSITYDFPFLLELFIATASMLVTYGSAIFAVTPHESHKFRYVLTAAAFPFVLRALIYMVNLKACADEKQEIKNSEENLCEKCRSGSFCRKCGSGIPKNSGSV